jgi:hypothetical protein
MNQTAATPNAGDSSEAFTAVVNAATEIKIQHVDTLTSWYRDHTAAPRIMFRCAGILTIILSAALPGLAVASFSHQKETLASISITIAVLTGLGSFFRWERTWHGNMSARLALEQLSAKWELEITNAKMVLAKNKIEHVYQATNDLLVNVRSVTSAESEGFFSRLQFPHTDGKAQKSEPGH